MSKTKIIALVALALVIVGGLGSWVTYSSASHLMEVKETKILGHNFSNIIINAENVGVQIRPAKEENTAIELVGQVHKSISYSFDATIEDGTLSMSADMSDQLSWVNLYPIHLKIVVSLPEKEYNLLQVEGNHGKIHLEGMQIDEIYCNTRNSDIDLTKITAKNIALKTKNAQIALMDVKSNTITTKTRFAAIGLKNVKADALIAKTRFAAIGLENVETDVLTARTHSAQIVLSTSHIDRQIDLETGSGSILVKTEREPENVSFEVSTGGGDVDLLGRYVGSVEIGKGDNLVRLVTGNGSIAVETE